MKKKLICFSYAGSGASYYHTWKKIFEPFVEIVAVQLPGHENKMNQPLLYTADRICDALLGEVEHEIQSCDFGIFGHSMGGILGFEFTAQLEKRGYHPLFCAVSSTSIEDYSHQIPSLELSTPEFLNRVFEYEALDKDNPILAYPEFQKYFLKILKADFNLIETYNGIGKKVKCPIIAMCGDCDKKETISNMKSWERYTESKVSYAEFTGNHFYLNEHIEDIRNLLSPKFA